MSNNVSADIILIILKISMVPEVEILSLSQHPTYSSV